MSEEGVGCVSVCGWGGVGICDNYSELFVYDLEELKNIFRANI